MTAAITSRPSFYTIIAGVGSETGALIACKAAQTYTKVVLLAWNKDRLDAPSMKLKYFNNTMFIGICLNLIDQKAVLSAFLNVKD